MVGGDWPVFVLAGGYVKTWTAYRSILGALPVQDQTEILRGTASRFYGVQPDA
jgi:L-fuconolactonase